MTVRPLLNDEECQRLAELLAELLDHLAGQTTAPGRDRAAVARQWRTRFAAMDRDGLERINRLLVRAADNGQLDPLMRIRANCWVERIRMTLRHDPRLPGDQPGGGLPPTNAPPPAAPARVPWHPRYGGQTAW
jgi:hypothetical protein